MQNSFVCTAHDIIQKFETVIGTSLDTLETVIGRVHWQKKKKMLQQLNLLELSFQDFFQLIIIL